jgi:hypothetical protein
LTPDWLPLLLKRAAGVTGKLWEMADMVKVLEDWESSKITV